MEKNGWRAILALILAATGSLACDDILGLEDRLEITFEVSPPQVAPGSPFIAMLRMTNTSKKPVQLPSGYGCIAFMHVEGAPWGDPVDGTGYACTAASRTFRLAVGETLSQDWELAAQGSSGELLAPGEYELVLDWNVRGLPGRAATFNVVPLN
jgi:hypothetical protein